MVLKKKTILFIGGGKETLPGVKLAKKMGLYVIVSDKNPKAPCRYASNHFILCDIYDIKGTLSKARVFNKKKKN